jgi:membrane associated rhomboid family serine protease
MIPISTDSPIRRTPWVNYGLIGVNVLIYLMGYLAEPAAQTSGLARGFMRLVQGGILDGADPHLYEFFTYQFLHAGFAHVAGNMLFLWVFGNPVNAKMGHITYLLFYLAGGVFAATGYVWTHNSPMLGASGAIAAVTTAYLALFPRSYITIIYWFIFIGTFELPSTLLIVFKMILWDNILAPQMVGRLGASNVAFGAHLAGYAFGLFVPIGMLALRVLPRDQFDIVALWRRWLQRRGFQAAMADPEARARAQYGRVARPISITDVQIQPGRPPAHDQVGDLRYKIAEALTQNDRDSAASLYEKLLEVDPRQVLSRTQQLDVANQLYTLHRLPQAASAYEKYLSNYANSPEADHVRLLVGIIYARDLQQYEVAEGHLSQVCEHLHDRRREQCDHWLQVARTALGRPVTGQ